MGPKRYCKHANAERFLLIKKHIHASHIYNKKSQLWYNSRQQGRNASERKFDTIVGDSLFSSHETVCNHHTPSLSRRRLLLRPR